ncbi:MAG: DUF6455 family protein [Aestuariivita sp.]|uniref:DUF6455 family protein n=1 Tax=Aestuariivita sp. TaxID=1872407 RepID=UPI003BB14BC4
MRPLGKLTDHVWLARRMGRAADVDLSQAQENGVLTQQDWADMVQTCRGCSWAPDCDEWLGKHASVPCAPATCLNRARLEELRRRQQEASA